MPRKDDERSIVPRQGVDIERLKEGGLISEVVGPPEKSMDGMVQRHLDRVALLQARGDRLPERPMYIFNPDTKLLINYALRRGRDQARSGFFADIVELDDEGRPRHGVSVVNPFETTTGFVEVKVGENTHGFAPSSIETHLDDGNYDDPLEVVPPNVEMADLLTMLRAEPIAEGESLTDFVNRQGAKQQEMRGKVQTRLKGSYLPAVQAMDERTDANYHLIVTDRDDSSALEAASREIGVFPIVIKASEFIQSMEEIKTMHLPRSIMQELRTYVSHDKKRDDVRKVLTDVTPAFLTADFVNQAFLTDDQRDLWYTAYVSMFGYPGERGVMDSNTIFSALINPRYHPDSEVGTRVMKTAHGRYEFAIDPTSERFQEYKDWLRKARLDFALTLYLRGLSEL